MTRAAHQASSLGDALAARGLTVVAIPAIALEQPTDEYGALHSALERLDEFDWLLFTSANAVEVFARECDELGIDDVPRRIGSIGAATSRALQQAGLRVSLQPSTAVSETFAAELKPHVRHQQVLLVQAESARDVLPRELRSAGAEVLVVPAYRTVVPVESADALRRELPRLDAATFTSSSSVRNLLELCDAAGLTLPRNIVLASIGPITSQTLRACGYEPQVEAPVADVEVLASLLAKHLSRT
ncbi:uroporphyrinogen-III synthase [Terriglobus aquaticus]|uniref:uroporphyrinogen-III synthase n=1 Tax=Terriglobus aquaticus TaxID=940139 RepID=UPI0021E02E99|nr:uroporphyrinogen-III synthase [Terriglobus aquaticus]